MSDSNDPGVTPVGVNPVGVKPVGAIPFAVPPAFAIHRDVLPQAEVERVRGFVTRVLGDRPAPEPGANDHDWSARFNDLVAGGVLEGPGQLLNFVRKSGVPDLCRAILGPDVVYSLAKSLVRDFDPARRSQPAHMHFDAHLFGPQYPMLTVWVPLNAVGTESPGLSIATRPNWPAPLWDDLVAAVDAQGVYDADRLRRRGYRHEEVYALAAREAEWPFIAPELDVGDVMIFDHQHIHGTQIDIAAPARRMSLEIRVVSVPTAKSLYTRGRAYSFGRLD